MGQYVSSSRAGTTSSVSLHQIAMTSMLQRASTTSTSATADTGFPGGGILAIMPVVAIFYLLLVLPFLPDDGNGRIENILFWPVAAAIVLGLFFYNRARINTGFFRALPIITLAAYFAFAAASITWAYNADLSSKRLIVQILAASLIILPYALSTRMSNTIPILHVCYVLALGVSAVYVLTTKPSPIGHPAYFTHKQEFGMFCATALILSFYELLMPGWRRVLAIVALALGFWLLFESQSKSSLAFSVIAMTFSGVVLVLCKYLRTTPAYIVGAIVVASLLFTNPIERIAYRLYGDPTLTGRTEIWSFMNYQIAKHPWFGWGFHSYWFVPNSPHNEAWGFVREMPSSHSGYMELKLETGKIGYWIFLAFIYASLNGIEIVRRKDPTRAWFILSVSVFVIMLNLTDSVWLILNHLWMLYLVMVSETVRYSRSANSAPALSKNRTRPKPRVARFASPRTHT